VPTRPSRRVGSPLGGSQAFDACYHKVATRSRTLTSLF
jgi:hypothetical protein